MKFWEQLAAAIEREPVEDRDRFFMAMLKPLGIEKGKPFQPDERQKKILAEGAFVGEAMAKANTLRHEIPGLTLPFRRALAIFPDPRSHAGPAELQPT